MFFLFFFFKQKTAYEMRISDWSSDVCSSDLAANTMILEKSCCETCQNVIQRYEQEVLKKQLGVFRTQVDAPSRSRKKDRITHVDLQFVEVDDAGRFMRDLGIRSVPVDELPLAVHL